MNVSSSITPLIGERLTGIRSKLQWADVDWNKVEEHVNRLQARITKAVKEQKWHLVKRLQYLITHSFYAKLLTVKRTAGVDGEKWTTPKSKMNAVHRISDKRYKAKPLRRDCKRDCRVDLGILEGAKAGISGREDSYYPYKCWF